MVLYTGGYQISLKCNEENKTYCVKESSLTLIIKGSVFDVYVTKKAKITIYIQWIYYISLMFLLLI